MSLPGRVNYFQERWNLDEWNNYARYSVYDDIPSDDFSKLNFPNKKNLLTQKKYKISVSLKRNLFLFLAFLLHLYRRHIYIFIYF